jgi:5-methylcytosine-specific restriction endonuclease McrA
VQIITKAEAKAAGLKRYFTGRPCKNGHIAERYLGGGGCVECIKQHSNTETMRAYQKAYAKDLYAANKDDINRRTALWRRNNPDKAYEMQRRYREKNPEARQDTVKRHRAKPETLEYHREYERQRRAKYHEKVREQARARYAARAEIMRERARVYHAENKEKRAAYNSQYCKANLEKWRASNHRRRAQKQNAGGTYTAADVQAMHIRQNGLCLVCEADLSVTGRHVDHNIPLARGGSNDPSNLGLLCPPCNRRKHTRTLAEFIDFLEQKKAAMMFSEAGVTVDLVDTPII